MGISIIFLDIDGVLNSFEELTDSSISKSQWSPETMARYGINLDISSIYVERLNRIIKATNAKIVISSSWRRGNEGWWYSLKETLYEAGIKGQIIGCTPEPFQSVNSLGEPTGRWSCRAQEINLWLANHTSIDGFVVLDDDWDAEIEGHFIKTTHRRGLQDEHIKRAIELLNK